MSDEFTTSGGAYVLGALTPAERERFEAHLQGCASCRQEVEDLAGLPGLLARVPADAVEAMDGPGGQARGQAPGPLPETLLPGLLRAVRRRRARRRWAVAALSAAAACAVAAALVLGLHRPAAEVSARAGTPLSMQAVTSTPITATVGLEPVAWGTRVDLHCAYAAGSGYGTGLPYALVVTDRSGHAETIGTWTALPGRDASLEGATSLPRSAIAAVEVRTPDGVPVLRLDASA